MNGPIIPQRRKVNGHAQLPRGLRDVRHPLAPIRGDTDDQRYRPWSVVDVLTAAGVLVIAYAIAWNLIADRIAANVAGALQ